jgi:hypothetical protein
MEVISVSLHVPPDKTAIHRFPPLDCATGPAIQNALAQLTTFATAGTVEGGSEGNATRDHEVPL